MLQVKSLATLMICYSMLHDQWCRRGGGRGGGGGGGQQLLPHFLDMFAP